jgi:predicted RNA binding protein YcfA (HicA-like mRNA interferase family)
MTKEDIVLTIPNPHKDRISVALLQRILKQANIPREE